VDLRFIAKEKGIVASAKDAIPSGASMPVSTNTAAIGKKTIPKGISRQSRPPINSFSVQGIAAAAEGVLEGTIWFVSVTTQYDSLW
jgi:hypothetical protein